MAVCEVIKMGNPLLRSVSQPIAIDASSEEFQNLVDHLIDTMRSKNGVGIAAPQIGILKRAFTMEVDSNSRYPEKESFSLVVAINPEITFLSDERVDSWEGCLSIPNIRGRLKRHKHIVLKAMDRNGTSFETELTGFAAIIAQHELDHLNGTLLIDRMENMETLTFQEEYEKYWL